MRSASGNLLSNVVQAGIGLPQILVGTAQTADGTVTSTSFAVFASNNPSLSFTATRNARWKISCNVPVHSATLAAAVGVRINASLGSPTLVFGGDVIFSQAVASNATFVQCFGVYDLVAGTAYTFRLEAKASAGLITLASSLVAGGVAVIGEETAA